MRSTLRAATWLLALGLVSSCGGSGDSPGTPPAPTPAPTPTPVPIGTIELLEASLPGGSVVTVAPMFDAGGQQAQQLWFEGRITLDEDLPDALVRAWVRTADERCMGGGRVGVSFQAGVPEDVRPGSMSSPGSCSLPYSTTHVEFEVVVGEQQLLQQQFPMAYDFVAEP